MALKKKKKKIFEVSFRFYGHSLIFLIHFFSHSETAKSKHIYLFFFEFNVEYDECEFNICFFIKGVNGRKGIIIAVVVFRELPQFVECAVCPSFRRGSNSTLRLASYSGRFPIRLLPNNVRIDVLRRCWP